MENLLRHGLPSFSRPEYPKNPEALQSSLAWSFAEAPAATMREGNKPVGLIYRQVSKSTSQKIVQKQTRPDEPSSFWAALGSAGLSNVEGLSPEQVCESLLDALEGVRPPQAKGLAAVPLTRAAAFLQNAVGVHAKTGPPDFAAIVDQMFASGADGQEPLSASALYYARLAEPSPDPLLRVLDAAIRSRLSELGLAELPVAQPRRPDVAAAPSWLRARQTPFYWFAKAWTRFCAPDWRMALPPRRWSDWASCVLRTAVGMGFLWEAVFYRELGRAIVTGDDRALELAIDGRMPLLEWLSPSETVVSRDVSRRISQLVADGQSVRALLQEQPGEAPQRVVDTCKREGPAAVIGWLRKQPWAEELNEVYGKPPSSAANNTIETVKYLLLSRDEASDGADFYGLLVRRSRRFLCVEPGPEWIVVVASLVAGRPGASSTLGAVRRAIAQIGLEVRRDVLVSELERAGLMKGSHDADDAIVVRAGF